MFETNVFGLIRVTQAVLPHLRKQRQRSHPQPLVHRRSHRRRPAGAIYNATKFAVEGFSEALAAGARPARHPRHRHRARPLPHRLPRPLRRRSRSSASPTTTPPPARCARISSQPNRQAARRPGARRSRHDRRRRLAQPSAPSDPRRAALSSASAASLTNGRRKSPRGSPPPLARISRRASEREPVPSRPSSGTSAASCSPTAGTTTSAPASSHRSASIWPTTNRRYEAANYLLGARPLHRASSSSTRPSSTPTSPAAASASKTSGRWSVPRAKCSIPDCYRHPQPRSAPPASTRLATLNNESRELNDYRLDAFDLRHYFDYFICSGYVHEMKPHARHLSHRHRHLRLSAANTLSSSTISPKTARLPAPLGMQAIRFPSRQRSSNAISL